ncbi:MAG: sensor histidine kinase [Pseudomonadota bacterium]
MTAASLRTRLFLVILAPLLLMALILGLWRVNAAQATAEELFDRSLRAAALAISKDVTISGGDALLPTTRDFIEGVAGGEVFYHATGPGGIYVTGYAYPPVAQGDAPLFEASYRGEAVRVTRLTETVTIDGLTGPSTVTVWQRLSDRQAFARELATRSAILIGALMGTLAIVVWFGVGLGLRPLVALEEAIAARSPNDLARIKRAVPAEVQGITGTLNRLFGQVEESMEAHKTFISDAAHQLRNPAAAVQSMAAAARDAPDETARQERLAGLEAAARRSARVANQLLSLDRLQHGVAASESFDLASTLAELCTDIATDVLARGIEFSYDGPETPTQIKGDRLLIEEAVRNLIDNALKHATGLTRLEVQLILENKDARITVKDDGRGLSPTDADAAFRRFSQVRPSDGSGLGLAIVSSVASKHNGSVGIDAVEEGASVSLRLPVTSG